MKGAQCAASNFITDEKMKDDKFIEFQLNCALERGPCDDIGNKIKSKFKTIKLIQVINLNIF